jgi:hypothetical protein
LFLFTPTQETLMEPIHAPFDPDNVDDGDLGWLWHDREWRLVATYDVPCLGSRVRMIVFIEPVTIVNDEGVAEKYRGQPFIPCLRPTCEPGK